MRAPRQPISSHHRFMRLCAWFGALLAWFARGALCATPADRRHTARYQRVRVGHLVCALRDLIVIRAAQMMPPRSPRAPINYAAPGFARRIAGSPSLRTILGSDLRRRMKVRGGLIAHAVHLIAMLAHIDAFAARIVRRLHAGATRVRPLIIVAPPATATRAHEPSAPCAADTS